MMTTSGAGAEDATAIPAIKPKEDRERIVQGSKQLNSERSIRAAVERRPKLLFLAFYFPPARAVACVRAWNIAKYLVRLGWEVTVVTPKPSVWRYVEDPQKVTAEVTRERIRRIS